MLLGQRRGIGFVKEPEAGFGFGQQRCNIEFLPLPAKVRSLENGELLLANQARNSQSAAQNHQALGPGSALEALAQFSQSTEHLTGSRAVIGARQDFVRQQFAVEVNESGGNVVDVDFHAHHAARGIQHQAHRRPSAFPIAVHADFDDQPSGQQVGDQAGDRGFGQLADLRDISP